MKPSTLIRLIFTIALLGMVWGHSHWSVALTLTFIVIGREVDFWLVSLAVAAFKRSYEEARKKDEEFLERIKDVYQTKTDQSN